MRLLDFISTKGTLSYLLVEQPCAVLKLWWVVNKSIDNENKILLQKPVEYKRYDCHIEIFISCCA